MSKRDEDSQSDIEVGMTTAERRRRRRRGGGLRVPSDNVPRSRTPTAPPAPRPEDPALAMSIAYSFTNDASGPVARVPADKSGPIAPEAAPTVIDPPAGSSMDGAADFEMKTREMSAVDLESLGLQDPASTLRMERISSPNIEVRPRAARADSNELEVDVTLDSNPPEVPDTTELPALPVEEPKPRRAERVDETAARPASQRLQTVALSEDDLEEVRAGSQPTVARISQASTPPPTKPTTKPPPIINVARTSTGPSVPPPVVPIESNKTQQLQAVDVEIISGTKTPDEPMSVPEIDINELADRAEQSGDIEVDIDDSAPVELKPPVEAKVPTRAQTAPPNPPPGAERKSSGAIDGQTAAATAAPPPTPAVAKAPPAPPTPPKKSPQSPPAAVAAAQRAEAKGAQQRGKPWFVDLFDEDYLRTLPFLTPQATQAEAEFVIDTMSLAPGAQVLDVGCGYGRHAMELAARGFHVVGLDLSTPLLVRGGEEAHRRGLTINFVRGDMRELDFENQFDGAYCLFSTFGYFDDETNKKTLQNIARALKPNGKLLVEILNRDYVIADLPTRVWWEGDGCVVLEEVELNYFSSRIQVNRSVVFDDGRQLEQEISVRAYSLHEVGKLMHAAGFRVLEVSGGYQMRGRFFGNQSRHIIVLAERKENPGT